MNVIFVNYHSFTSNSAVHIFNLANRLVELGTDCAVCVPAEKETVRFIGDPRFLNLDFREAHNSLLHFRDGNGATIIHAWTPRESVRRMTQELVRRYQCPYVVHLEDNEEKIVSENLNANFEELLHLPLQRLDEIIGENMAHPQRYREFLSGAAGVTVIVDKLLDFKPVGLPSEVIWPAYDEERIKVVPVDLVGRRKLGITDDTLVVVYPGNVHSANKQEMFSLYLAVGLLNRRGVRAKLIKLGQDFCNLLDDNLSELKGHIIDIGYRPHHEIAGFMAMADILVQPGVPGTFNDFRIPAKLAEFLATGRPVILPNTNIGRYLKSGEECLLLEKGNALEIADKLQFLWKDVSLREQIGHGGRRFAEKNFSWTESTRRLQTFYEKLFAAPTVGTRWQENEERCSQPHATRFRADAIGVDCNIVVTRANAPTIESGIPWKKNTVAAIYRRYSTYKAPILSYATVKDYCDSMEHLGALSTINRDMKDVQRPWVLKAILGSVKRGARLLEIGAGEPFVADFLSCLGYEVLIVDPYDGTANGPRAFETFTSAYPHIRFIRDYFTEDLQGIDPGSFDGIYSISVLEHIPTLEIGKVFNAMRRFLKAGGYSIHAIDHVHRGEGDKHHLEKLHLMIKEMGIPAAELENVLQRLDDDVETYFLSAFAHNLWRGDIPYEKFPMRRCVSIHTCTQASL
jgi:glycosyltransferase involved in cell wall biosynthesis